MESVNEPIILVSSDDDESGGLLPLALRQSMHISGNTVVVSLATVVGNLTDSYEPEEDPHLREAKVDDVCAAALQAI